MTDQPNDGTQNLILPAVRVLYPNVLEAKGYQGNTPKYSASFLIPKDHAFAKTLWAAVDLLHKTKGEKKRLPEDRICIDDGDYAGKPGGEGCWIFKASNRNRPQVLNRDRSPILEVDQSPFYSGVTCDAVCSLWFMNNQFGKRVLANLYAIRFLESTEALSGQARDFSTTFPELPEVDGNAAPDAPPVADDDANSNPFDDLNDA